MADYENKYPENVPGAFFTDELCIFCDQCFTTAPSVFKPSDDDEYAIVYHQPETDEELALARDALEGCPVEAIGELEKAIIS